MRFKGSPFLLLTLFPSMASADLRARYAAPDGRTSMTIGVATNGNLRSERTPGAGVVVVRDGQSFFVENDNGRPIVTKAEDLATATHEAIAKLAPDVRAQLASAPQRVLVMKGTLTVQGRTGDAYYSRAPDGTVSDTPFLVISHDPALAPLGQAMAVQFEIGGHLSPTGVNKSVLDAMQTGTPVLLNGLELGTISDQAVDPTEFTLPAPAETLDQVRERLAHL